MLIDHPHRSAEPLIVPPGFVVPDFSAPLDLDAHAAGIPANAMVKGMFIQGAIDAVRAAGKPPVTDKKFAPFKEYSMQEHNDVLLAAARALHPDAPLREALRRVGLGVFPAFSSTLLGRVMYGVFGGKVSAIFKMAQKSFAVAQSLGRIETKVVADNAVVLRFTHTYSFLDCNHVGVLQGTLAACKKDGTVALRLDDPYQGEMFVTWWA